MAHLRQQVMLLMIAELKVPPIEHSRCPHTDGRRDRIIVIHQWTKPVLGRDVAHQREIRGQQRNDQDPQRISPQQDRADEPADHQQHGQDPLLAATERDPLSNPVFVAVRPTATIVQPHRRRCTQRDRSQPANLTDLAVISDLFAARRGSRTALAIERARPICHRPEQPSARGDRVSRVHSRLPQNAALFCLCAYCSNRPRPNPCKSRLPTLAGSLGCVVATSATDLPTRPSTGVARKAWISPLWGPLCTVAMPEICPRSLILLAEITKRLESAGISALMSVITPFCQMKPWDQLKSESKSFPTTWPRLLMPVAKALRSPGRGSWFVSVPSGCQRAATYCVSSALRPFPAIWPTLLMT